MERPQFFAVKAYLVGVYVVRTLAELLKFDSHHGICERKKERKKG